MSNYNIHSYKHAKKYVDFGFSQPRDIDNKYLNFEIFENNNEINIFFDKKDLNLIGWQTEDIYQNLSITFISSVKKNQEINNKIFNLPKNN